MEREIIKRALAGLCDKNGDSVTFDERLLNHSTIRTGGTVFAWYEPGSPEELRRTLAFLRGARARILVLGNGSNVLMPDGYLDAVVVNLSGDYFTHKEFAGSTVTVGAGEKLSALISECCVRGLSGLEGLVGVPGTVGGALITNAGYRSAISDCLSGVKVIDAGENIRCVKRKELAFGYRTSSFSRDEIIIEAVFELRKTALSDLMERIKDFFLEKLRSQPLDQKTLGCIFKNPLKSGYKSAELIDMAGMKGMSRGGAVISQKHANFIVNSGNATSGDVRELIRAVQDNVRRDFSVDLVPEIEIIE